MTRRSSNRFSFEGSPFDLPLSAIAGGPLSKNVRPIFLNHAMPPGTRIESTESIGHLGLPGGSSLAGKRISGLPRSPWRQSEPAQAWGNHPIPTLGWLRWQLFERRRRGPLIVSSYAQVPLGVSRGHQP